MEHGSVARGLALLLLALLAPLAAAQRLPQIVVFTTQVPATMNAGFGTPIGAQASSGLPVTFETTGVCIISNVSGTRFLGSVAPGSCTVTASQAGNASYEPASVSASVEITWYLFLWLDRPSPLGTGQAVHASLYYWDNGGLRGDTACAIDWGDPAAPGPVLGTPGSNGQLIACDFSHAYSSTGNFRVTAAMFDSRFGYASRSGNVAVTFLSAWKLTGGGRFHSPPGTFGAAPQLSGTMTLQLDVGGGAHVISFALESPSARFEATTLDSWRVTESRAELVGSGRDHEGVAFTYYVHVLDGGSAGPDRVRLILINGSGIAYDSQPGAPTGADPATVLDGSISITPL